LNTINNKMIAISKSVSGICFCRMCVHVPGETAR
jgi:hypothetical protein